jgi:hypothetical protein
MPNFHQHQIFPNNTIYGTSYLGLGLSSRLESNKAFISNYSYSDNCDRASSQLLKNFNDWFASDTFRPLREKFLAKLKPVDTIRIIVQTENIQLQCLPWHLLDWLEPYSKTEIAISNSNYEKEESLISPRNKIRILVIIDNSQGIDTERDRLLLERLPNSLTTLLVEPTRQ